ncbi:MAG: FAD:protein FMN transferase [Candidatus Omnitrophica bacterium]|nr:FAD:protein FMN transferase [Candidatus Omnitrophota bacterium]
MSKRLLIFLFLFAVSCSNPPYRERFVLAGTYLEVIAFDKDAAKVVYQKLKKLDNIFNKYSSDSQVYQLNHNIGREVEVAEELIEVIETAIKYQQLTRGAFDISKGYLYDFWKKVTQDKKDTNLFDSAEIEELKKRGDISRVKVDPEKKTAIIDGKGANLDLSGIAKGYMVDQAIKELKKHGIDNALVNLGGEMYCLGRNQDKPWRVGIRGPLGDVVQTIEVVDKAVATSGNYEQFYKKGGKVYSHLIDPAQGRPVKNKFLSITVIAEKSVEADILATAFFIRGKELAREIIEKGSSLTVYFVTKEKIEKIN